MAERKIQQIKATYGEILGIANETPSMLGLLNGSVTKIYNGAIDELNVISDSNYSRFKVTQDDYVRNDSYSVSSIKPKMSGILTRLEQEYGFSRAGHEANPATTIITVNNNNQLSVTVVPIQQVLQNITDDELRADIEELRKVLEQTKDKKHASSLLNAIQQKSWDVFIALLPVVLDKLGR